MKSKKVAIIGAGVCGLIAIKECRQCGLEPVCFEKTTDIGGLWRYKPTDRPGESSVMKSTVTEGSKEMIAFSDFPPPDNFPNYLHNTKVLQYFHMYADHFNLLQHIQFQTEAVSVVKSDDYLKTGRWIVSWQRKADEGEMSDDVFDAVFICTGHHCDPHLATFEGLETFTGTLMHSHSYKTAHNFEDKRVVVVGTGNSAMDIVVELSHVASQVFLSTRRGAWVWGRVGPNGMPTDANFNVRLKEKFRRRFHRLSVWAMERQLNAKFDHSKFGLKPQHHVDQQHLTLCDALPDRILTGSVIVKPNVQKVEGNSVTFDNGNTEDNIDAIILCTGYSFAFPFLTDKDIEVEDNRVLLYKNVFPPSLPHPTLAAIGLVQPTGVVMPVAEMQLRFACHLLANRIRLPTSAKMTADIRAKQKVLEKKFVPSRRHTIEVNSIEFMDELASMIGCHPDPLEYLLNDPVLCYHLWMGPCTPYQYRLKGPNVWLGARKAIVEVNKRILTPLQTAKQIEPKPIVTGDEVLIWWILHIIIPLGIFYLAFAFH